MPKNERNTDNPMDDNKSMEEESGSALPVDEGSADETSGFVKELEEQKEKYIRLLAEFENYKRRTTRERLDFMRTAGQDLMKDLLPVLDDAERAEKVIAEATSIEALKEGLRLISDKLKNILTQKGLTEMECLGKDFDADTMEAITEIAAAPELKGKVVEVLENGYILNDRIIRYAKVIVGK